MPQVLSSEESVTIVDDRNRVIGAAPRWRMRRERLPHRATFIFVFATDGRLLIQRRSADKDLYPSYYDLAAGGVVAAGEDYARCACREAEEELGISDHPLEEQREFYYEDADSRCFGRIYHCRHDGPFRLQTAEISEAFFVAKAQLNRWSPLSPDTRYAFARLLPSGALA